MSHVSAIMKNIRNAVDLVKVTRRVLSNTEGKLKEAKRKFEEDHSSLIDQVKQAKAAAGSAETKLRQLAYEEYVSKPNHDKQLMTGVSIRVDKMLTYGMDALHAWCIEHNRYLVPDVNAFEEYCKSLDDDQLPSFVTRDYTPTVLIAKNL